MLATAVTADTQAIAQQRPLKLLRFPVIRERTGLSRSTVWRMERRGQFPRHVRICANVVGWREDQVTAWIESRTEHRDA